MSVAIFFIGVMTGFSAVLLFCMWIAARPKPEAKPLEFTALSAGGDTASVESVNKELLDKVFRAYGDGKLFELPTTKH